MEPRAPGRSVPADAAGLRRAAELLRAGSVVAFPTETVYGLGADAFSAAAVAEVYRLKGRPAWNPLIAHVASVDGARELAAAWPEHAELLARAHWPGPLTLVVRRAAGLPSTGLADNGTIAVRVPAHPVALALLRESGLALAAPSANRSEAVSPTTAEHVLRSLPDVPLVLDGGACRLGIESTVIDVTGTVPRLLRPGALGLQAVREVVGDVDLPVARREPGTAAPSPGMSRRHYSPRAKLEIHSRIESAAVVGAGSSVGLLLYDDSWRAPSGAVARTELLPPDPQGYGADLYAALHRLDDEGVDLIVVQEPPQEEAWMAVRDRLTRAAA